MANQEINTSGPEIPYGFCACGCGNKTTIGRLPPHSYNKFLKGHHMVGKVREDHPVWTGGRFINYQGYVMVLMPNHHRANPNGYVPEHIIVLEKHFNRPILPTEHPHHIDENKTNNHIGNLIVFKTASMHLSYHTRLRAFKKCGHWNWRKCRKCHKYHAPETICKPKTEKIKFREFLRNMLY